MECKSPRANLGVASSFNHTQQSTRSYLGKYARIKIWNGIKLAISTKKKLGNANGITSRLRTISLTSNQCPKIAHLTHNNNNSE